MYKIATLNKISPVGLQLLGDDYAITENIDEAAGILVRSQDMLEMSFSKELYAIARAGAGVNNIPCERCADEGIVVFNTPGANANAVVEMALCAMLAEARNLIPAVEWAKTLENDTPDVAKAVEKGKGKYAGHELRGKNICIIGLGAIGILMANACEALGMNVIGYAPFMTVRAAHDMSNTVPFTTNLTEALADADYVTIHVPASPATNGMINADTIRSMKDGVTVLNFSRDKLVNEPEMLEALKSGKVRKYITDFPNNTNIGQEGVLYTPHLGASTEEAEDHCAVMAVHSLMSYIEHGNIEYSVCFPDCSLGNFVKGRGKSRICVLHKNVPATISTITAFFGDMHINIDNMVNKSKDKYAYTILDVDTEADEEEISKNLVSDSIIKIRVIK